MDKDQGLDKDPRKGLARARTRIWIGNKIKNQDIYQGKDQDNHQANKRKRTGPEPGQQGSGRGDKDKGQVPETKGEDIRTLKNKNP
jgi:hypothetical protein